MDEFIVEAVTLKKLKKIRIGHNGNKAGSGWFLDKLVVHPVDDPSNEVVFECNRYCYPIHLSASQIRLVRQLRTLQVFIIHSFIHTSTEKTNKNFDNLAGKLITNMHYSNKNWT